MPLIIARKVLESFEISVTLRNIFTKYKALWTSQLAPFLYVVFSFDTLISSTNTRVHDIPFTLMWCSFLCFDSCHWTLLLSRVKLTFEVIFPQNIDIADKLSRGQVIEIRSPNSDLVTCSWILVFSGKSKNGFQAQEGFCGTSQGESDWKYWIQAIRQWCTLDD